jgi:hypothetical protein
MGSISIPYHYSRHLLLLYLHPCIEYASASYPYRNAVYSGRRQAIRVGKQEEPRGEGTRKAGKGRASVTAEVEHWLEQQRKAIRAWEGAKIGSREEREAAEAATGAASLIDRWMCDGGFLPSSWRSPWPESAPGAVDQNAHDVIVRVGQELADQLEDEMEQQAFGTAYTSEAAEAFAASWEDGIEYLRRRAAEVAPGANPAVRTGDIAEILGVPVQIHDRYFQGTLKEERWPIEDAPAPSFTQDGRPISFVRIEGLYFSDALMDAVGSAIRSMDPIGGIIFTVSGPEGSQPEESGYPGKPTPAADQAGEREEADQGVYVEHVMHSPMLGTSPKPLGESYRQRDELFASWWEQVRNQLPAEAVTLAWEAFATGWEEGIEDLSKNARAETLAIMKARGVAPDGDFMKGFEQWSDEIIARMMKSGPMDEEAARESLGDLQGAGFTGEQEARLRERVSVTGDFPIEMWRDEPMRQTIWDLLRDQGATMARLDRGWELVPTTDPDYDAIQGWHFMKIGNLQEMEGISEGSYEALTWEPEFEECEEDDPACVLVRASLTVWSRRLAVAPDAPPKNWFADMVEAAEEAAEEARQVRAALDLPGPDHQADPDQKVWHHLDEKKEEGSDATEE